MKYSEFFALLDEAGLSPEQAAQRLGVSNMTLRRWQARAPSASLEPKYIRSFGPVFKEFAAEGLISSETLQSAQTTAALQKDFTSTLTALGFPSDILNAQGENKQAILSGLAKVGADDHRIAEVERNTRKVSSMTRLGEDWKSRIGLLRDVVRSKKLASPDKSVAYGALFYMLMPFDLIPDAIPVIGLLDDMAMLGLAVWFYQHHAVKAIRRTASLG
jgi:uncharacterized membrane protein YkvA (DUF1232 family)